MDEVRTDPRSAGRAADAEPVHAAELVTAAQSREFLSIRVGLNHPLYRLERMG
jgi:hypothetical protein